MKHRLLVLDGHTRTALAVCRSFARQNISFTVASPSNFSYVTGKPKVYPNPSKERTSFKLWLENEIASGAFTAILPLTDQSCSEILGLNPTITVLAADQARFQLASDKMELGEIASALGIGYPKTILLRTGRALTHPERMAIDSFPYPAVMKLLSSVDASRFKVKPILYLNKSSEVYEQLDRLGIEAGAQISFLLQQRTEGVGVGVFVMAWEGETLTTFCHRRLLEKPPSGGVSVLSESISEHEAPVAEAKRLIERLGWSGPAMVEFKQGADGQFYLMEVNGRLWGSLQLAIDCGRNFPGLLYDLFLCKENEREQYKERIRKLPPYIVGQRLRWWLGTVDHLLIRMKQEGIIPVLRGVCLKNELHIFEKDTRSEIFRFSDPMPAARELIEWIREI